MELIDQLVQRGFVKDRNFEGDLPAGTAAYIGFDLTADSLHAGSLIQLMVLRRLITNGFPAFALLGEATTRIGDPSGKDESRPRLDSFTIECNGEAIRSVIERIVPGVQFVSNHEWFDGVNPSFMEFLDEYGPHFTINRMMTFDSVKTRLDRKQPLTFLEFSYMLLQAVDFREMRKRYGVTCQIGGSDQWGNIINGADIIRRKDAADVFAITTPLLLDRDGKKFGKSAGKPIWLAADKTPVFDFFQFWRNTDDADVRRFFLLFTEIEPDEIDTIMYNGINEAKKLLALAVTTLVHGWNAAEAAQKAAEAIFERGEVTTASRHISAPSGTQIVDLLVLAGLAVSKSAARRLIEQNAVRLDGTKVSVDQPLDRSAVLRAGKQPPVGINLI